MKRINYTGDSKIIKRIVAILNEKAPLPLDGNGDPDWGTSGQVLTTDGSGSTSWTTPQSGGGDVTDVEVNGTSVVNAQGVAEVSVPTATSDLTNDSGFITNIVNDLTNYYTKSQTYTQAEVNSLIAGVSTLDIEVVQSLPTTDISQTTIYLVPKQTAGTQDVYDEYINLDGTTAGWEHIGSTEIDLSNYYTKTETDTLLSAKVSDNPTFTEASTRANIASGESFATILGKIKKYFTDLKDLAFIAKDGASSTKYLRGDGTWQTFPTIPTVNNATLTIQKNGQAVQTFTANSSSNKTANITVPTKVSELTNDSGFVTTDTNNRRSFYGTCDTAAATAAKVITLSDTDGWELKAGTVVGVKFTNSNTASSCTLNVNGSGAKSIYYNNAAYTGSSTTVCGEASKVLYYMYDGTYWVWAGLSWIYTDGNTKVTQTNTTTSADYRVLFSANANDTTETTTARKSTNLLFNPSTGEIAPLGYRRINITGQTLDLNTLTLSTGSPQIAYYICKTTGGSDNISNMPVARNPFILDVEAIRVNNTTDYITRQTFRNAGNSAYEYVRFCTSGTWSAWTTRKFTDTWTAMVGATSSANGSVGYVNATPPKDGYNTKFLRADGTWSLPAYPTKVSDLTNDSGFIDSSGSCASATTASKLGSSTVGGANQPIYLSSGTATACNTFVPNTGGTFNAAGGTAGGDESWTTVNFGNSTGRASAKHSNGRLRLYRSASATATTAYYTEVRAGANTANRTITFPNASGTVAIHSANTNFTANQTINRASGTAGGSNVWSSLVLGNATGRASAGHSSGDLYLYNNSGTSSTTAYYTRIVPGANTANRTLTLPNATGTVALTTDAVKVKQTNNNDDANYRLLMSASASDSELTEQVKKSGKLLYNPLAGKISITQDSAEPMFEATRSDTGVTVRMGVGVSGVNHGVYSAKLGKWLVYGTDTDVHLQGAIADGRILTSAFANHGEVANGAYAAGSNTIPNLCDELRYSSGCMGSVNITTQFSGANAIIPVGWYNYIWIPHRTGGIDGVAPAQSDNCDFGQLLLFSMDIESQVFDLRYNSGTVADCSELISTRGLCTWLPSNGSDPLSGTKHGIFAYSTNTGLIPSQGIPTGLSAYGTLFGIRSTNYKVMLYLSVLGEFAVWSTNQNKWVIH